MAEAKTTDLREEGLNYFQESRSLAVGIISVLPLMFVYHWGIVQAGHGERNLAEMWLMGPLRVVGLEAAHLLNVAVLIGLVGVLWRSERVKSFSLLVVGVMIMEGLLYAAIIYRAAPLLAELLHSRASRIFAINMRRGAPLMLALGAGVYEELIFRLLLIGGGTWALNKVFMWGRGYSLAIMILLSGVAFALAHHLGPSAEPVEFYNVVFRSICGMVLGVIFVGRGLGVAVWTHSLYNVMVMVQPGLS
jgi:hypothetical protein